MAPSRRFVVNTGDQREKAAGKTPIEELEGVGPAYARKLRAVGIRTVEDLLSAGAKPGGRAQTGIGRSHMLRWCNQADLMRIAGVGKQYARLLEAAGIDTVKELRNRNAADLAAKLAEVNGSKAAVRRPPGRSMVERWVANAKSLESTMRY